MLRVPRRLLVASTTFSSDKTARQDGSSNQVYILKRFRYSFNDKNIDPVVVEMGEKKVFPSRTKNVHAGERRNFWNNYARRIGVTGSQIIAKDGRHNFIRNWLPFLVDNLALKQY